jgi:hypothetical protein
MFATLWGTERVNKDAGSAPHQGSQEEKPHKVRVLSRDKVGIRVRASVRVRVKVRFKVLGLAGDQEQYF